MERWRKIETVLIEMIKDVVPIHYDAGDPIVGVVEVEDHDADRRDRPIVQGCHLNAIYAAGKHAIVSVTDIARRLDREIP